MNNSPNYWKFTFIVRVTKRLKTLDKSLLDKIQTFWESLDQILSLPQPDIVTLHQQEKVFIQWFDSDFFLVFNQNITSVMIYNLRTDEKFFLNYPCESSDILKTIESILIKNN